MKSENTALFTYNKSLLNKLGRLWLDIGLILFVASLWDLDSVSFHKHYTNKKHNVHHDGRYAAILTPRLVNNPNVCLYFNHRNITINVSLSFVKRAVCDVVGTIKGSIEPGEERKFFYYLS